MRMGFWLLIAVVLLPFVLAAGALLLNRVPLFDEPGIGSRLRTYLGQNTAELRPDSIFPELRPQVYAVTPEVLCRAIAPALDQLGWRWERISDCHYTASVTTPLLRFTDDLSIEAAALGSGSAHLKVRSRSRVGRGDFGANTRHILDFNQAVEKQLNSAY